MSSKRDAMLMDLMSCVLVIFFVCFNSTFGKEGIITTDTNWFEVIDPTDKPSMSYEFMLNVEFPTSACCPIVHLRHNESNHCTIPDCCFDGNLVQQLQAYYRNKFFELNQKRSRFVNCIVTSGLQTCHVKIKGLSYVPRKVHLDFGYLCDDRNISLKGLKYSVSDVVIKNTTTCEPVPKNLKPFQCEKFYSHTTFPNIFGHFNKLETLDSIDLLRNIIRGDRLPCHKHLFYLVCQTFFPRCAEQNTMDSQSGGVFEVDAVVPLCKEMCYDFKEACATDLQPMINVIDCHIIPYSKETSNCVYMEVSCTNPPVQIPDGPDTFPVNSTLKYMCPIGTGPVDENQNVTCTFSGEWTEIPECTLAMEVKILIPVSLTTMIFYYWLKKRYYLYNQQHNFVKRNRQYDAFVQHSDAADDEAFVTGVVLPNLEPEQNAQFKLFWHRRDFLIGDPIFSNIQTAITTSNAAIILLSQAYVDSSWCCQEFNLCLVEHNNDEAFKLFVTFMQPVEQLKRLTPAMDIFLKTTTYLERHDPQLLDKLKGYLVKLRG